MRKTWIVVLIISVSSFFVACGVKSAFKNENNAFGNPKSAATKYLKCLLKKDYDKAKTLATKETASNLDMMKVLGTDFGLTEVKDVKCFVNGNTATCTFCCTKDTSFKELKMINEGGKWLAHQPKEMPPIDTTATEEYNDEYSTPKTPEDMEKRRMQNR